MFICFFNRKMADVDQFEWHNKPKNKANGSLMSDAQ